MVTFEHYIWNHVAKMARFSRHSSTMALISGFQKFAMFSNTRAFSARFSRDSRMIPKYFYCAFVDSCALRSAVRLESPVHCHMLHLAQHEVTSNSLPPLSCPSPLFVMHCGNGPKGRSALAHVKSRQHKACRFGLRASRSLTRLRRWSLSNFAAFDASRASCSFPLSSTTTLPRALPATATRARHLGGQWGQWGEWSSKSRGPAPTHFPWSPSNPR